MLPAKLININRLVLYRMLPFFVLASLLPHMVEPAWGGSLRGALKAISHAMSESSDETIRMTSRVVGKLAHASDEALEHVGQDLKPAAKRPVSSAEALTSLRRLHVIDTTGEIASHLDTLGDAGCGALIQMLAESHRVLEAGVRGRFMEDVLRCFDQVGPESLLSLRAMETDEGVAAAVRVANKYFTKSPERFVQFVKEGDEGAIRWLAEHGDRLNRSQLEAVLKKPSKYLDEAGRLLPEGEALLTPRRPHMSSSEGPPVPMPTRIGPVIKVAAVAAVAAVFAVPEFVIKTLEPFIGKLAADFLRRFEWWVTLTLLAVVFWWLRPLLWPVLHLVARGLLWMARFVPQWLGGWLQTRLQQTLQAANVMRSAVPGREQIRLGILGVDRAGKSTFIVMLTEKLKALREGAHLEPLRMREDGTLLNDIRREVAQCLPTRDDRELKLRLTWPYQGDDESDTPSIYGGKAEKELVLTDFPGEWARTDASEGDRWRLVHHLEAIDGLFVILDPTELEQRDGDGQVAVPSEIIQGRVAADGLERRMQAQQEAIQGMFAADGLDLGERFCRTIVVIINKRDMLTPDRLLRLANRPDSVGHDRLGRMQALAAQPALSAAEAQELGEWLLDAMFPHLRSVWEKRLHKDAGSASAQRVWHWLRRMSEPQMAVFAVSFLGPELGEQVAQHLANMRHWQATGAKPAEQPTVQLDFSRADKSKLDFHLPFAWMFDHLPQGLLHQANRLRGWRGLWYRLRLYSRFAGHPSVRQDRVITWRRGITGAVVTIGLVASLTSPLQRQQSSYEAKLVRELFAAAAQATPNWSDLQKQARQYQELASKPYQAELGIFQRWIQKGETMQAQGQILANNAAPPRDRYQAGQSWLQEYLSIEKADYSWPAELQQCRWAFESRLRETVMFTVPVCLQMAEDFGDQFDQAIRHLNECTQLIPGSHMVERDTDMVLQDQRKAISVKKEGIEDAQRVHLVKKLRNDIETITKNNEFESCLKALQTLDHFQTYESGTWPTRLSELRSGIARDRDALLQRLWDAADKDVARKIESGNIGDARVILWDVENVPDPNPYRFSASEKRKGLNSEWVKTEINKARQLRAEKPQEALAELEKVHALLKDLPPDDASFVDIWYREAVGIRQTMRDYGAALLLLQEELVASKQWTAAMQWTLAAEWGQVVLKESDDKLRAKSFPEARAVITSFRGMAGQVAPQDIQHKLQEQLNKIAVAERSNDIDNLLENGRQKPGEAGKILHQLISLKDSLKDDTNVQADRPTLVTKCTQAITELFRVSAEWIDTNHKTEPDKRLMLLLTLKDQTVHVDNLDVVHQWLRRTIDAYEKAEKYREAIEFLGEWQKKEALRLLVNELLDGLWRDFASFQQRRTDEFLVSEDIEQRKAGWEILRRALQDPWPPSLHLDTYHTKMGQFLDDKLDRRLDALRDAVKKARDTDEAQGLVRALREELGGLLEALPSTSLRNAHMKHTLIDTEEAITRQALSQQIEDLGREIARAATMEQFKTNDRNVAILGDKRGFPDDLRGRLTEVRNENWRQWELHAYKRIRDHLAQWSFDTLVDAVREYLSMREDVSLSLRKEFDTNDPRRRALADIKTLDNWLRTFEDEREYKVTGIRVQGVSAGTLWNYDPYVLVEIHSSSLPTRIIANDGKKSGDFSLSKFVSNTSFKWKKGDKIVVGMWHKAVERGDKKDHCMGKIELTNPLALLRLALDEPVRINQSPEAFYYKDLLPIKIGLDINGLKLPVYLKSPSELGS